MQRSSRTYRGVFRGKRSLRHVVLPELESMPVPLRQLVRPLLRYEQRLALLLRRDVPKEEREELGHRIGMYVACFPRGPNTTIDVE